MSAESLLADANAAFVDEDFDGAASLYDEAVKASNNSPSLQLLLARAANSIKRKQYQAALSDADAAIAADSTSNVAHNRRGTSLFYLDRFAEAKSSFSRALELGNKSSELMIRKCEAEINRQTKNNSNTAKTTTTNTSAPTAATKVTADPVTAGAAPVSVSSQTLASKVKEQWFQSKTHVTITLFVRNLPANSFNVELTEGNKLSAKLTLPDGSIFTQEWKLFAPVNSEFKTDLSSYRLEIILTKLDSNDWSGLLEDEKKKYEGLVARENIINANNEIRSVYPTSAKKKIEWNEIEQTAKKLEEEEKPTGDAALQKLFQSIYKDSDEDTRRAMIKSFQTSGGTVLSTNWKEVGTTDYTKNKKAPDGQEFKDFK